YFSSAGSTVARDAAQKLLDLTGWTPKKPDFSMATPASWLASLTPSVGLGTPRPIPAEISPFAQPAPIVGAEPSQVLGLRARESNIAPALLAALALLTTAQIASVVALCYYGGRAINDAYQFAPMDRNK